MSIMAQIEQIMTENEGKIYSIKDFEYLGKYNSIKSALYYLSKNNKVTRIFKGLYVKPTYSKFAQEYCYPSTREVAEKIAENFNWKISPTGEAVLNYTGISTQIPNIVIYVSDGPSKTYIYRNKQIIFKHTSPKNISYFSREMAILIQAIKMVGKNKIKDYHIRKLALYPKGIKEDLIKDSVQLPIWIQNVLKLIKEEKDKNE